MIVQSIGLGRPGKNSRDRVGATQHAILRFIVTYPTRAHGVGISSGLRQKENPEISDGQVYVALKRLEARGYIEAIAPTEMVQGANLPSHGGRGRPRKLYRLTKSGEKAFLGADKTSSEDPGGIQQGGDHYAAISLKPST